MTMLADWWFNIGGYDLVVRIANAVRFLFRKPLVCDCDGLSDYDVRHYQVRGIAVDPDQPHHPCCSAYTSFFKHGCGPANDDPHWLDQNSY